MDYNVTEEREMLESKADMLGLCDYQHLSNSQLKREVQYASRSRSERTKDQPKNNQWYVGHLRFDPFHTVVDIPIRG